MLSSFIPTTGLIRRELARTVRAKRFAFFIAAVTGLPAAAILLAWPSEFASLWETAERGYGIPAGMCMILAFAAFILLPGYASAAVVSERDQDTYEMMTMSLLTPAGILAGKLASVIGTFLFITLATLPVTATVYFIIDLDWQMLPAQYALICASAMTCAAAGLLCSVIAATTVRAIVGSYLLTAFLLGGYALAVSLVYDVLRELDISIYPLRNAINPFVESAAYLALIDSLNLGSPGLSDLADWYQLLTAIAEQLCIASALLFIAWLMLRRRPRERAEAQRSIESSDRRRKHKAVKSAWARPFPDHKNAVFVRELRALSHRWRKDRYRIIAIALLAATVFVGIHFVFSLLSENAVVLDNEYDNLVGSWVSVLMTLAALVAPGASTPLWVREQDQGTRDLLNMTLLRPRNIVFGKAHAATLFTATALVIVGLATAPLLRALPAAPNGITILFTGLLTVVVEVVCLVALGSQTAQLRVRTPAAIILSYLAAAIYLGSPVVYTSVGDADVWANASGWAAIMALSPVTAWSFTSFAEWSYIVNQWNNGMSRTGYLAVVLAGHCGLAALLFFDSARVAAGKKRRE